MYDMNDTYLYEIFEDYKEADETERLNIWKSFCEALWEVPVKRQKYVKKISYKIPRTIPDSDVKDVFAKYSEISYTVSSVRTQSKNSWCLLKQRINNIYTKFCDPDICTEDDYISELRTAQRLYYCWIKNHETLSSKELRATIEKSLEMANQLKAKYSKRKIKITWNEYKKLINEFLKRCLNNYKPLSETEKKDELVLYVDFWSEDNYVIKYLSRSLYCYMQNYEKEYFGVSRICHTDKRIYRYCDKCGKLFLAKTNHKRLCSECSR